MVLTKYASVERYCLVCTENNLKSGNLIFEAFVISNKAAQKAKTRRTLFQPIAIFQFFS